jgi:hypothetical protein
MGSAGLSILIIKRNAKSESDASETTVVCEPHYTSECELCQLAHNNHSATPEGDRHFTYSKIVN